MKFKSYSRISKNALKNGLPSVMVPNLLAMQIDSFNAFLQKDVHPMKRDDRGLQHVLNFSFPS